MMRRVTKLNNVAKAAIATTAVTVGAVAGATLFSPSTSASPSVQSGCSPPARGIDASPTSSGKLTVTEKGVRFSFRVATRNWGRFCSLPTDKSPRGPISLNKSIVGPQGAEAIIYWTSFPNGDYADACADLLAPSIGRSAAALVAAVSTADGTKLIAGPSDVTLGGHAAKHVVLRVRDDVGCDPGFFYSWRDVYGGALWPTTRAGDTIRVWIVPVNGTRLFIAAATTELANARLKSEVKRIVESIRFA